MAQRVNKTNTPQVWDKVWTDPGLSRADEDILATEAATKRWRRIREIILSQTGSFKKLKVVELGAGIGTYAALMAAAGAEVTLVDYSSEAIKRAKQFFRHNRLKAKFVQSDVFDFNSSNHLGAYDISISIGLAEHFRGKQRLAINQLHLDVIKENGLAIIDVPNSYNPPYRIFKVIREMLGIWEFGEEYPYTKTELRTIAKQINGLVIDLFGDDLYTSLKFLLPANFLRRIFKVDYPQSKDKVRVEKGTVLDDYLAYSLILVLKKRLPYFLLEEKRRSLAKSGRLKDLGRTYRLPSESILNQNTKRFWDKRFSDEKGRELFPMEKARNTAAVTWTKLLNLTNPKTLNLGCGDGKLEKMIVEAGLNLDHSGFDIAADHIKQLQKLYPQFLFKVHNILTQKLPPKKYDISFMLEVLEHIEPRNTLKVLKKVHQGLKKNGYLLISVPMNEGLEEMYPINPNSHMRCYSTELIMAELEMSGFSVLKYREFWAFSSMYFLKDILARTLLKSRWRPNNVLILARKD